MKSYNKWLGFCLVICLISICVTACNAKGNFAAAKAAMDRTLALETFQMDGTLDTWSSAGEFGFDTSEIAMENASQRGKIAFSELFYSENGRTNYYLEYTLTQENPTWLQNTTQYWYEDGFMYSIASPTQFRDREPSAEEAVKAKGEALQTDAAQKARPHPAGGPGRWRHRSRLRAWQDF